MLCMYSLPISRFHAGLLLDFSRWNILCNFTSMQRAAFMVFCYFFGGSWHVLVSLALVIFWLVVLCNL